MCVCFLNKIKMAEMTSVEILELCNQPGLAWP